jgi:hypothetical protein
MLSKSSLELSDSRLASHFRICPVALHSTSRDEKLRISNSDAVPGIVNAVLALLRAKPMKRCQQRFKISGGGVHNSHSLVGLALLVLRILAVCIAGAGSCESDARGERHHGDEEDEEFHFDR